MKKLSIIAFLVALLTLLTVVVYAHSGKTDSRGGHYDTSTGDYHYHHGYSAHDHYDMDGDGNLDCPYQFNDKTNNNSSGNIKNNKDKITFLDVVKAVLLLIPLSLVTLHLLYIFLGLLSVAIEWFATKCFKRSIEDSIMERILHISMIIGLVILLPIEFFCILKRM